MDISEIIRDVTTYKETSEGLLLFLDNVYEDIGNIPVHDDNRYFMDSLLYKIRTIVELGNYNQQALDEIMEELDQL